MKREETGTMENGDLEERGNYGSGPEKSHELKTKIQKRGHVTKLSKYLKTRKYVLYLSWVTFQNQEEKTRVNVKVD